MMMWSAKYPNLAALVLLLLLLAALLATSDAFSLRSISASHHQQTRLFGSLDRYGDGEKEEDEDVVYLDNIEEARNWILSLRKNSDRSSEAATSLSLKDWKEQLSSPPPLTSIGRARLTAEMALLESLAESDDAIPQLWNLWFHSRGPSAAEQLTTIEGLLVIGHRDQAEARLRKLIDEEGIHWVEPVHRLSTLLFFQGRLQESKELCEMILTLKPWHFGALSRRVQICSGLEDEAGVLEYGGKMMPSLERRGVEARRAWVAQMVENAQTRLALGERGLGESFQRCDDALATTTSAIHTDDADAWQ